MIPGDIRSLGWSVMPKGGAVARLFRGDLLERGHPESHEQMVHRGYTKGLQLIRGVVFEAHFRERGRHGQLAELVA